MNEGQTAPSLSPDQQRRLQSLLQGMERSGGWPDIPRLQLRTFMDLLQRDRPEGERPLAA